MNASDSDTTAARYTGALRLGTRGSALAMAQSELVAAQIRATTNRDVVLVPIRTHGDTDRSPLTSIGGTGVFVAAVREALLAGEVDFAVHSYKDLPTEPAEGIRLAAVPVREDPADVLCAAPGATLRSLPHGALIGTGSPRRAAQLLRLRPDLKPVPIRGNVDTRLRAVQSAKVAAVVVARAGLARLGRLDAITETFRADDMLPAPAQGALAIECRHDDAAMLAAFATIDDEASRRATEAERAVLVGLRAGCAAPVGALALMDGEKLTLTARVIAPDGGLLYERTVSGSAADAGEIGARAVQQLREDGADEIVHAL